MTYFAPEKNPPIPKYHGMNIYQRLHSVMGEIDFVQKETKKVNGQYTFVSHDAVTALCRKSFFDNGILSVPTIIEHQREWATRKSKDKKDEQQILLTTVGVRVDFFNIDDPKDQISTVSYGYGLDDQDKGMGKAYSYAVKYAYLKALGLETGDDPEKELHEDVKKAKPSDDGDPLAPTTKQPPKDNVEPLATSCPFNGDSEKRKEWLASAVVHIKTLKTILEVSKWININHKFTTALGEKQKLYLNEEIAKHTASLSLKDDEIPF